MDPVFLIIAAVILSGAVAAMSLRNLVHCALFLVLSLLGIALAYLNLGAEFVGFAQILVYIGAVAILIVFALLLTRNTDLPARAFFSASWPVGLGVALLVFGIAAFCILSSDIGARTRPDKPEATVRQLGESLMTNHVMALELVALLLTAALIGAVLIALVEPGAEKVRDE